MTIGRAVAAAAIVAVLTSDGPGACPDGAYAVPGDPLLASPGAELTGDVRVCGCDGVTYGNDCERIRARAPKDHDGPCASSGT